jgi:hypothetical protein
MLLSHTELVFVRLLRGTVIATACVALVIAAGALVYAAYARFSPEPTARLSSRIDKMRQAADPANLIREIFPKDSGPHTDAALADNVPYQRRQPSTEELFSQLNKFLEAALSASFESQKQFSDWLFGSNQLPFSWSGGIDDKNASNDDNVNVLWRSLFLDYAKRLTFRATSLRRARDQRLFPSSFDRLTAPTGRSSAPYFVAWFFQTLQKELASAQTELAEAQIQRAALRLTVPISLAVAAGAFGYFITIMFLFLIVSIEASVRHLAEASPQSPRTPQSASTPISPVVPPP